MHNDEDIKIASSHPSRENKKNLDKLAVEIIGNLTEQRKNGNMEKAQELGRRLAFDVYNYSKWPKGIDSDIKREITILRVFSIYYSLEKYSKNSLIAEVATSVFTSTLRDLEADYYKMINRTGSYSIYLLAVKKEEAPEHILGNLFSKQINMEQDKRWEEFGKEVFKNSLNDVEKRIEKYKFK